MSASGKTPNWSEMIEILIIDDNRVHTRIAEEWLTRNYGAAVTVLEDGEDALAVLACADYRPHLVLLELKNRNCSGYQMLRKIRRQRPKLPVVIWSASRNTEDILRAYAEGANMFAEKPLDLAQFRTTIENIARLWIAPLVASRAASAS
jgi:two-component system, sensor histidine kinase ChiS